MYLRTRNYNYVLEVLQIYYILADRIDITHLGLPTLSF
jgi:hypothetical protein